MLHWPLEGVHGKELAGLGRTEPAEKNAATAAAEGYKRKVTSDTSQLEDKRDCVFHCAF
jgi:hypothetical protein